MADYLYLHVPFCNRICSYCDFNRFVFIEKQADAWLDKIALELASSSINPALKTIYIGGGTPTALTYSQLERLLQLLSLYSAQVQEYTVESNLELSDDKLALLVQYGVNRISLGVQSFNDDLLAMMNRQHRQKDIIPLIKRIVEAGIENISIDLIYGFKEQSLAMWEDTLKNACSILEVKHLSLYSLTVEENSVLGKKGYIKHEDDMDALMYQRAIEVLENYGFTQYEIANFAREGYQSQHNQAYWHYEDFYGIGVGSSSKLDHCRIDRYGTIKEYLDDDLSLERYDLTLNDEIIEFVMMNLRLREGLSLIRFKQLFNVDFMSFFKATTTKLMNQHGAYVQDEHFIIGVSAMFFLNDIIVEFMEELDEKE